MAVLCPDVPGLLLLDAIRPTKIQNTSASAILNCTAWLVANPPTVSYITTYDTLHWLPVEEKIQFRSSSLTGLHRLALLQQTFGNCSRQCQFNELHQPLSSDDHEWQCSGPSLANTKARTLHTHNSVHPFSLPSNRLFLLTQISIFFSCECTSLDQTDNQVQRFWEVLYYAQY